MNFRINPIQPPSPKEKNALRLMIFIGLLSMVFFLYTIFQKNVISYYPLYVLLIMTMAYYCIKYLHEWYHYFSISSNEKPIGSKTYTVDILTTYCAGEPFVMLERTLTAIQNITYQHTAWCCDEADDPNVKQLCLQLGVKHVTRANKKDAKAGNINNALGFANGELCVVLDPDHIPAPEFLDEIVNYFDDTSIGFVQIVQAYYNQSETLVAKGAAQQTYQFYGPMMMTMHKYGTVQAIGANCTFRRIALDSIGGHASGLAEDMHTAMRLHAAGWRSIYVPAILTRGLVPATMSSYYKQQLKWSRGTWELLVATYPKLFTKFTWRQKLHYFTLPFHYLSGIIFFINFLIPVVSLFTGYIPLQMDVLNFFLAVFPLFAMSTLIRHYVQKWVAEEKERGFHLVGGILQIGTWWIHSIGFVYTIFRKKVPYIPTPKNDNNSLPFILNVPNILVAVISLIAIVYGLLHDFNPYTIFMIALAGMQILFMVFNLSISGYVSKTSNVNNFVMKLRENTWLITKTHGFLRRYSLRLSFLLIILFVLAYWKQQQLPDFLPRPLAGLQVFYRGLSLGNNLNAFVKTSSLVSIIDKRNDIAIISSEIAWGVGENNQLDTSYLHQVYDYHAIPLIAWEPWQNDNANNKAKDTIVMQRIATGKYDSLFLSFATQIAHLNKPIYLSFINKPIENKFPLFNLTYCKPKDFIAAWQHVHTKFDEAGANKVIWVWNPPNAATAKDYFPGYNYVDWLGVNVADTNKRKLQIDIHSFDTLYRPYHSMLLFKSGLPVMLTNIESPPANTIKWWNATWNTIDSTFTEVKSVIIDIDPVDYPVNKHINRILSPLTVKAIFENAPRASMPINLPERARYEVSANGGSYRLPVSVKCVVYDKGYHWFRNKHTLGLKTMEADIKGMKKMGINTLERSMPGIYDHNLSKVLALNKMYLIPRLWFLATPEIIADDKQMQDQKEKILQVIKENLEKKYIIAWSLGDDVLHNLANQTYKPDYFYYEQKYVLWLSDLCQGIRLLDTLRPIIMDLHWDVNGRKQFHYYKRYVPQINNYMLSADTKDTEDLKESLEPGMAWGQVPVEFWHFIPSIRNSGIIPAWQDIETTDYINLNGLLDLEGRKKQWYRDVLSIWANKPTNSSPIPKIKILKPAQLTQPNRKLTYHALYKKENSNWQLFNDDEKNILFEWYLVKLDQYGNTMFIKKVGKGPYIELSIPKEPEYYKLYIEAVLGEDVKMTNTTLNTPLE
jgi:cellulose synthase (UDP-forming)